MRARWTKERAVRWQETQHWRLGCNFIPSNAGNQLEFWNQELFDTETLERELDYAASLGIRVLRVFLHDLAWETDSTRLLSRLASFLDLAAERDLAVMPVLFDDCWHEPGSLGPAPQPKRGVHNSLWLRSPGIAAAKDPRQRPRLEAYVRGVMGAFAHDSRILAWDLYNELGNFFLPALAAPAPAKQFRLAAKGIAFYLNRIPTLPLFRDTVRWGRDVDPDQPLTSPLWLPRTHGLRDEILAASDIISFHDYLDAEGLKKDIEELEAEGRPLICTEYLARTAGSLFQTCVPLFKDRGISCMNWGLVAGRTQTIYSWENGGRLDGEPKTWYHDILRRDGSPYSTEEVAFLRSQTKGS